MIYFVYFYVTQNLSFYNVIGKHYSDFFKCKYKTFSNLNTLPSYLVNPNRMVLKIIAAEYLLTFSF